MHPVDENYRHDDVETQLLLLHYGELSTAEAQRLREKLASDSQLAVKYAELCEFLDSVEDPHAAELPDDFYGRRLSARVLEKLPEESSLRRPYGPDWRWLGGSIAAAMALVAVFMLGRFSAPPVSTPMLVESTAQSNGQVQARLLNASLSQHLEASSRFLRQVDNANPATVDLKAEKNWASTLLIANRIYRFAAEQAGQHRVAAVLQDMEPILLEMANQEGELTNEEFARLRKRIESRDLLFKVDVTSKTMTGTAMEPNRSKNESI